jgi:tetratricopeptide (TPR) repeat protein
MSAYYNQFLGGIMQAKRDRWVYVVLIIMLLALIGFSGLPLVGSILQENQLMAQNKGLGITRDQQIKLEAEANGYQKVLEREPNNQTALKGLLALKIQQQDLPGAIVPLEKLAQLNPKQTEYSILLAQAKQQTEDLEGAAAAYKQILAKDSGNLQALSGITSLYLFQDLPQRAIALLQDTLKQAQPNQAESDPTIDVASVKLLLGEVYSQTERYADANQIYEEAIAANPEDFRPVLAKALNLKKQGEIIQAKTWLERAGAIAPAQFKDQISQLLKQVVTETVEP